MRIFHRTAPIIAKGLVAALALGFGLSSTVLAVEAPADWAPAAGAAFAARDAHFASPVAVWKEDGKQESMLSFGERGRAIYGRHHEWLCDGGSFVTKSGCAWLASQVDKAGTFSLELTLAPRTKANQGRTVAWSFGGEAADAVALEQEGAQWRLRLKTAKEPLPLFTRETAAPFHLVVCAGNGAWRAYVDGKPAGQGTLGGNAAGWGEGNVALGASGSGAQSWRGRIEGVAVYPRMLGADEAAQQAAAMQARRAQRQPATVVRFRGTLVRQAETSALEAIRPYTRSLTMAVYKVEQVLAGEWKQPMILVLHWALMDSVRLPLADRKPGAKSELSVELLAEHPELEPNRRDELPDVNLEADVFYCEFEAQTK
jgi:hypothetical protein